MNTPNTSEAIILIKASPQVGEKHGETVCCAGIDLNGNWLRLYPVSFRHLSEAQKFKRWEKVSFKWWLPKDDTRLESRRIDQQTLEVVGTLSKKERENFLAKSIVTSLNKEREKNRSLALLKPTIQKFHYTKKADKKIQEEREKYQRLINQPDLLNTKSMIPIEPCPFEFKYKYKTDDGDREGTCQDWEVEATFYKWKKLYGEEEALSKMQKVFGEELPQKGMLLAMGTHSQYPDTWLINGIIRLDEIKQLTLF